MLYRNSEGLPWRRKGREQGSSLKHKVSLQELESPTRGEGKCQTSSNISVREKYGRYPEKISMFEAKGELDLAWVKLLNNK